MMTFQQAKRELSSGNHANLFQSLPSTQPEGRLLLAIFVICNSDNTCYVK